MKLAEALVERSDLNTKIHDLEFRIGNNVLVQDGEDANEDPLVLLKELNKAVERLNYLIAQINLTNCQTKIDNQTVTEWIAKKDALTLQQQVYRSILQKASQNTARARGTEIKIKTTISVKELQKKYDAIAKEIRIIDNKLQATNWTVDLMES